MPCAERLDHLIEESGWQEAVVITITAADFPEIVSGPIEFVALGDNDLGMCVVKSEVTLDRGGNFDSGRGIGGRSVRDRQNYNDRRVVRALDRQHDHARAILAPFFP